MMMGATWAKRLVTDYLQDDLPYRLTEYRNNWNISNRDLPDPEAYTTWEPLVLDTWPSIITVVLATPDITQDDYDYQSNPKYTVRYDTRTYVWCKAVGSRAVTEMRDHLTTVVREALLDHPALTTRLSDSAIPCQVIIDQDSMSEEFSDLTLIKGDRVMAGAYVGYDIMLEETIERPYYDDGTPLVQMLGWDMDVSPISKLPNAPDKLRATAGDTQVDLVWRTSTWDGGRYPVTGYRIEQTVDGGNTWTVAVADTGISYGEYDVTGLVNGTTYQFRVGAINAAGIGSMSTASLEVTPSA